MECFTQIRIVLLSGLFFFGHVFGSDGYVSVDLKGQFGNQLFEIATAYAYALDHNLALRVPDLIYKMSDNVPFNAKSLFLDKISSQTPPFPEIYWHEPSFNFHEIPDSCSIRLHGHFQSELYFKHRRQEILDLFSPPRGLREKILVAYPVLASDQVTVGIQIRDYRKEFPKGDHHPTIGRDYYRKAISHFPENTVFLVASNNLKYAKDCLQGIRKSIIYLRDTGNYIEQFYTLALCKSLIISNSTFGWWAAWIAENPNKKVIAPNLWFTDPYDNQGMTKDIFPEGWNLISYKDVNKQR